MINVVAVAVATNITAVVPAAVDVGNLTIQFVITILMIVLVYFNNYVAGIVVQRSIKLLQALVDIYVFKRISSKRQI